MASQAFWMPCATSAEDLPPTKLTMPVQKAPAPILPIGRGDLEHYDPGLLHEAQEPSPIAAGRLDTDALDLAERAHPGEHLSIALAGTGEGSRPQHPVLLVDHRRDMWTLTAWSDRASLAAFGALHAPVAARIGDVATASTTSGWQQDTTGVPGWADVRRRWTDGRAPGFGLGRPLPPGPALVGA